MANRSLFRSLRDRVRPADTINEAGGRAYALPPEHALAQFASTGCLNGIYYASAEEQLDQVLRLCGGVAPSFIAKVAVHARTESHMKDVPALLVAALSVLDPVLFERVFPRVIDNPRMLRTFVQIVRSGRVARRSFGSRPKRLIQAWFDARSDEQIFTASIGRNPSLADVIRLLHPRPRTASRSALYAYLLGRAYEAADLPPIVRHYEDFKAGRSDVTPDLPFQFLAGLDITEKAWRDIATNASWQSTRMNLNTYARHGVFDDLRVTREVARRLVDPKAISRARVLPYQLMAARTTVTLEVPKVIRDALDRALELATDAVPELPGRVAVGVDVSASMHSPVTGRRGSSTSSVRCVDVAALVASAVLRRNRDAVVLPFHTEVVRCRIDRKASIGDNAQRLANLPSGGTDCSAPLRELERRGHPVDLVVLVSDNESWIETNRSSWRTGTRTLEAWERLRRRNPKARLVCIDLQPYGSVQAPDREDILNVGGFSDAVFRVLAEFAAAGRRKDHWVDRINRVDL